MADVASTLPNWSVTESSNLPADATTVGSGMADNFQQIQATVRAWLAHKGADIVATATTDLGAIPGLFHDITGSTGISSFGTVSAGIWKIIKFEGTPVLTHNATSLILPGSANITAAVGDMLMAVSEGGGNWRVVWYTTLAAAANPNILKSIIDAAGDLIIGSAADTVTRLAIGAARRKLAVNAGATAPEWVADTQNTVVDAAGDLIYGTADNTIARLAIGTAGQILKTNSAATAPEWGSNVTLVAETALAGATSYTIASSIPSWVKKIEITFEAVGTDGTSIPLVQVGDAGGPEALGYVAGGLTMDVVNAAQTTGFPLAGNGGASRVYNGVATLVLKDSSNNTWAFSSQLWDSNGGSFMLGAGVKSLSAVLTQVVLTTVNGTDALDAGSVAVIYYE